MAAENRIQVEQLRVGVFVHLDLGWMNHPFSFNSFKVRSEDQIQTIRQLGITTVRWDPDRSDANPLPPTAPANERDSPGRATEEQPSEAQSVAADVVASKQARKGRLVEHRERIARVQKEFVRSARIAHSLDRTIFSLPDQALNEATGLVKQMVDTLLAAPDLAICVTSEYSSAEDAYSHSLNVSVLAMILARELRLPSEIVSVVGMGALFHDVGLSQVPARIVNAAGPLTKAERAFLELHCQYGFDICKKAGLPSGALQVIYQHHECFDGSGSCWAY